MSAPAPSAPRSCASTASAFLRLSLDAASAVSAWVTTPMSTWARSGLAVTVASPVTVIDGGRGLSSLVCPDAARGPAAPAAARTTAARIAYLILISSSDQPPQLSVYLSVFSAFNFDINHYATTAAEPAGESNRRCGA